MHQLGQPALFTRLRRRLRGHLKTQPSVLERTRMAEAFAVLVALALAAMVAAVAVAMVTSE